MRKNPLNGRTKVVAIAVGFVTVLTFLIRFVFAPAFGQVMKVSSLEQDVTSIHQTLRVHEEVQNEIKTEIKTIGTQVTSNGAKLDILINNRGNK